MKLTWQQCQAVIARCLYKFILVGSLKAYGVIMEETVLTFQAKHYVIGFAFSLQSSIDFLIAPLAGVFDKRLHPRIVATIGGFLAGLGFMGRAFLTSKELWLLFTCLSLSGVGFGLVDVITLISIKEAFEWSYPTAYSVTLLFSYVGITFMPALLEFLQRVYGEQIAMGVFGILSWTLMLSGVFTPSGKTDSKEDIKIMDLELPQKNQKCYFSTQGIHMRNHEDECKRSVSLDETTDTEDYSEKSKLFQNFASSKDITKRERTEKIKEKMMACACARTCSVVAKNHPELLFLTFLSMLYDISFTSWSIFLVPYGEYLGLNSKTAVWLSTVGGIAGLVGRLFCVALFCRDKMNMTIGFLIPIFFVSSSYVISLFYNSFPVLAVVAFLSGFGLSMQGCVISSWLPYCVCGYNFKTVLYCFYVFGGIMTMAGGMVTGAITDISGSYRVSFASLAVLSVVQAIVVVVWLICPSVPSPEKSASSRKDMNTSCCYGYI